MYTQCPDCEIAFKVTADVLKQAAGKVRCGGCGNAFNALAYLSEQMPKQPTQQQPSDSLPELKPEIIETDSPLPQTISAEQSAALLKTLDELAGSDIRIEDTGVEWRVLDEAEAAAPAAGDVDAGTDLGLGFDGSNVDEYLDDAETPVDEFLTATPEVVDSPEIFEDAARRTSLVDELRFDDNTPLPDDFDLDDQVGADTGSNELVMLEEEPLPQLVDEPEPEPAPEFALSEPDEWTDILDEFEDVVEQAAAPTEVEEAIPEDAAPEETAPDEAEEENTVVRDIEEEPLDMDTQFALQAEAMGIDLSGIHEVDAEDEDLVDELEGLVGDLEQDIEIADEDEPNIELEDELEDEVDDEPEEVLEDEPEEEFEDEPEDELDVELEQLDLIEDDGVLIEEPIIEAHTIEAELAGDPEPENPDILEGLDDLDDLDDLDELDEQDGLQADTNDSSGDHYVPDMTEEEHTVNMQIDQELMALAIEDEDGFASTIIIPEKDAERKAAKENLSREDEEDEVDDSDAAPGFETIIMEGDFVRSALDSEKLAADVAEAAKLADLATAREAEEANQTGGNRYGIIGGIALLVVALALQAMHQSREALATIPAFSNTVGQVYRAIGQPVQPAWDITGWRFEATKGSTEGEEEELTIYSRLGNKSDGPLPYPLIGISLTDRFEETIGSRILDPAEYLPTDLDPRKLVEPGNTFNAVITIKSTTADATGFKLNVCYRQSDGQLRCAIDDFK